MVQFPRGGQARRRLPWRPVVLAVAVILATHGPVDASPHVPRAVPAAIEGIGVEGSSTYELVADEARVHVTVEARLTNLVAPRVVGRFVESSFLDVFSVPMLAEATGVVARRDGRALAVDIVSDNEYVSYALVDLSPDLQYGSPQTVVVEYDLPARPPRDTSFTRINDAFVTFGVFAIGDPGSADVTVSLPDSLEVEFVGGEPVTTALGDRSLHRFEDVADPDTFFATVAGRNDDALVDVMVEVSDVEVVVRGWPGDAEWADFVSRSLTDGIPSLEELIGSDWPADDRLEVVESASPYLYGYSGWFVPSEHLIEVGDELDEQVVLHELAHLWFNDTLFEGRWISEGLAEAYANRAREEIGGEPVEPTEPAPDDPGAQPLDVWSNPALLQEAADAQERYGYGTSFLVIDRLLDDVGEAGMRDVLAAADRREVSYVGDGEPEELSGPPAWRQLLDLVEERAGADDAVVLFDRFVIAEEDRDQLERRAAARAAYRDLADAGDEWTPPFPVRLAMTRWDFDEAETSTVDAHALLERRDLLLGEVVPVGADEVLGLERAFERSRTMAEVRATFSEHEQVADLLVEADDAVDGAGNPLAFIGQLGGPADEELDRAVRAFETGDLDLARTEADEAIDIADGATAAGALRAVPVVVLLLVATSLVRRNRRSGAPDDGPDEPRASPFGETDGDELWAPPERTMQP